MEQDGVLGNSGVETFVLLNLLFPPLPLTVVLLDLVDALVQSLLFVCLAPGRVLAPCNGGQQAE
jgi:hypothetical protein